MMLQTIYDDSSLTSLFAPITSEVSFKGIGIRISGTNGATAAALADVGRIVFIKGGRTLIDCDFGFAIHIADLLQGYANRESTNSAACDLFAYFPRRFNDNNVECVTPSDKAIIRATFGSNLATRIASGGRVEILLDIEQGVQRYELLQLQQSDSIAGAGTRPMVLQVPNICAAFLSATVSGVITLVGSNISQLSGAIGGMPFNASLASLQDWTSQQFNVEDITATAASVPYPLACCLYSAEGDVSSRLFDELNLVISATGASTPEIVILGANFNQTRLVESIGAQRARLSQITARKTGKDTGAIQALQTIASTPTA